MEDLNRTGANELGLRSLVLAGNDLSRAEQESHLASSLEGLINKTHMQHLDLSLTKMRKSTACACIKALTSSRSVQSLHLSGPKITKLREAAKAILGHSLFDDLVSSEVAEEVSQKWNSNCDEFVPQLEASEVDDNVASSLLGINQKKARARELS